VRETTQVRAMDDYFHSLLLDDALLREDPEDEAPAPALQRQTVAVPEVAATPYLEADTRLAQLSELLAQVGQVQFEMDALSHEEVHVEPFQLEAEVVDSEPLVALAEPMVEAVVEEVEPVALAVAEPAPALEAAPAPSTWENLDTGNEFQALFFDVAGVTFAVPLTELGGIHQLGEVTSLFGQPGWYKGIMTSREQKMNVVDTAQWVMPGPCHQLKGTELLHRDQVKWRHQEGKRPWLAGMVKEKMCALLHVRELLLLLGRGVNIEGR